MKVVYNNEYGGFRLPAAVVAELFPQSVGLTPYSHEYLPFGRAISELERHDPRLVAAVMAYIEKFDDTDLAIADVPGDRYWIQEYDGSETVWTPETIPWVEVK